MSTAARKREMRNILTRYISGFLLHMAAPLDSIRVTSIAIRSSSKLPTDSPSVLPVNTLRFGSHTITAVAIERVVAPVRAEEILQGIIVVIAHANRRRPSRALKAGLYRHVGE